MYKCKTKSRLTMYNCEIKREFIHEVKWQSINMKQRVEITNL